MSYETGKAWGTYGGKERFIWGFGGEICGKETTYGPRRRWENNIRTDLTEISWESGDWINLAQDRDRWRTLVKKVMNIWVP
jgi:hypothetical protein